jgi:hypothetical protein
MWVCPIWINIKIQYLQEEDTEQSIINILAFFSIVSSSGIIVLARVIFDSYMRKKVCFVAYVDFGFVQFQEEEA